jgi:hypothetical protein
MEIQNKKNKTSIMLSFLCMILLSNNFACSRESPYLPPRMSDIIPKINDVSFSKVSRDEKENELISAEVPVTDKNHLLSLVKQITPLKKTPDNAPALLSEWGIDVSIPSEESVRRGTGGFETLYYYPKEHLLAVYYSDPNSPSYNLCLKGHHADDCIKSYKTREQDGWAKTTPELDTYLQKAMKDFQRKKK